MSDRVSRKMEVPILLGGLFLLNALLLAPRWITAGGPGPPWVALEVLLVAGGLALLPRRNWSMAGAAMLAPLVLLVTIVALGDVAARMSLARPLNLYLDLRLAPSVGHLVWGSLGPTQAVLLALLATVAALGLTLGLALLLSRLPERTPAWSRRIPAIALIVVFAAGMAGDRIPALGSRVATPVIDLGREQVAILARMLDERERFAGEMAASPAHYRDVPGLLTGLGGRDVILAFVESYGMTALDDPRYAPVIRPRLEELEEKVSAAGLHMVTGSMEAPIQGGQSWLGRGAMLSGLWLDNQLRYELLLASDRDTLVDDFRLAGYRTVALMPAITMVWPEGERFGYDRIYAHRDIDYRGPALNWVTMPDQFTWHFLETTIRADPDPRPLFAEVALISSHAPWTPILPVLEDWEEIGDGEVFAPWENAGERPEELWLDSDRVREHFALSVDYALATTSSYVERFMDSGTFLIVLGDHQPAPLITGDEGNRDVPVHVIAQDPDLLRPFLEWNFARGAFPDPNQPAYRMDQFRDWFIKAYSPAEAGHSPAHP